MRSITNIFGIILIIVGILLLAYRGVTYTQKEKVAQIGSLEVTTNSQKTIDFPPVLGGLSLVVGVVLVVVGRIGRK